MEKEVRDGSMGSYQSSMTIQICLALLVVFISVLAYILKRKLARGNTVLIAGLMDSGKTILFSKLINPSHNPKTYTSFKENRCENVSISSDKVVTLVDFPGFDRLRKQFFVNYLQKDRSSLKGIVFVIDSSTFSKKARDVAAFLYDVLYETEKKIPVLVACNKQDCPLAKSSQEFSSFKVYMAVPKQMNNRLDLFDAVRTALEREFGFINGTREAALESTDGGTKKRTLTNTGKNFQWDDLTSPRLDFIECFTMNEKEDGSNECEIEGVQTWIASL